MGGKGTYAIRHTVEALDGVSLREETLGAALLATSCFAQHLCARSHDDERENRNRIEEMARGHASLFAHERPFNFAPRCDVGRAAAPLANDAFMIERFPTT